jgi:predicted phage terminase large subunit-like protein
MFSQITPARSAASTTLTRTTDDGPEMNLAEFVREAWHVVEPLRPYVEGWHVRPLAAYAEAVLDGRVRQIIVNQPPATMKSLLWSVFLPAFAWGPYGRPDLRIMRITYADPLTVRDANSCRRIMRSRWYRRRWGESVQFTENKVHRIANTAGGWMFSTSVGGVVTGEHPDVIVFDDPLNAEDAYSKAEREKSVNFVRRSLAARGAARDVALIAAGQRLHWADTFAYLLTEPGWERISIPMRYDPAGSPTLLGTLLDPETGEPFADPRTRDGEVLCPALIPEAKVVSMEHRLGPADAKAQLQQRPSPEADGATFPAAWLADERILFDELPPREDMRISVLALDPSLGKTEQSDPSAFVEARLHKSGTIYVDADIQRRPTTRIVEHGFEICLTGCHRDRQLRPDVFAIEGNGFQELLASIFVDYAKTFGFAPPVRLVEHYATPKTTRVKWLTPFFARGEIRIRNSPGGRLLLAQLRDFPHGKHDDGPDALEMAVRELYHEWTDNFANSN